MFKKLLEDDLLEYQKTGNLIAVDCLCELLAYFRIKNVICSSDDIIHAINAKIKVLDQLENVYIEYEMGTKYARLIEYKNVLEKYKNLWLNS